MRRAAACVGMFLVVITSTTIAEDQPQAGTLKTLDRPALERWLREAVTIASDDVVDTLIPLRTATLGKLAEAQSAIGDAEGAAITRELLPPAAVPKVPKRNPATAQVRTANKVEDQVQAYDQRISDRMQILGNDFQQKGENLSTVIQGTALAESLNKSGNREAARRVLNLAMMLSEKDPNDSHNALLVARSEIAIGDLESARATLARTEQRLNETPKLNDRAVDLHDVIATYWILGDKEHARGIVQKTITAANFDRKKESDKQVEFLLPRLLATIEDYEAAFRLDAELYTGRYRYTLIESMTHRIPGSPANYRQAYEDPLMSLAAVRQALAVAFRYVLTTQPADRPHPSSD